MSYPEPHDYPESDTQPRVILAKPFSVVVGLAGWFFMKRMYGNPYKGLILHSQSVEHEKFVKAMAELIVLGLVAVCEDGFQLTADGRYYIARFDTPEEAHDAYCKGSEMYHGEFGRTE